MNCVKYMGLSDTLAAVVCKDGDQRTCNVLLLSGATAGFKVAMTSSKEHRPLEGMKRVRATAQWFSLQARSASIIVMRRVKDYQHHQHQIRRRKDASVAVAACYSVQA